MFGQAVSGRSTGGVAVEGACQLRACRHDQAVMNNPKMGAVWIKTKEDRGAWGKAFCERAQFSRESGDRVGACRRACLHMKCVTESGWLQAFEACGSCW